MHYAVQINIQLKLRGSGFKDINMIYIDVMVQLLSHCPVGWWVHISVLAPVLSKVLMLISR